MDRSQLRATARELLERHIADTTQPNRSCESDISREASGSNRTDTDAPIRPTDINYSAGRAERDGFRYGGMARQQAAAIKMNNRINAEYFEHVRNSHKREDSARDNLDQHIQQQIAPSNHASAREALELHFKATAGEVTRPPINPHDRERKVISNEIER